MTAPLPAVLVHQPGVLATEEIVARLTEHARQAQGALAPETERALRKASAAFSSWAGAEGVAALPASPEALAAYVDALSGLGRRPASIRQAVWAVATLHRAAALPDPSKAEVVRLALKRMSRTLGTRQRQAAPLGKADVNQIFNKAGMSLRECRDVALLLTMRDMLARRSEVVALEVADLRFAGDGGGTVLIKRSKTDQAGAGAVCWLRPRTVGELRRWLDAAGITKGPIFRRVGRPGIVGATALADGEVPRILKRLVEQAGLDPAAISGHSLRVGMAQDLVANGADLPAVMQAGRWRSPTMPARYAERLLAERGAVARLQE
ncbi:site-specific integrase [Belnapia sp. T6]|uniref:Site-specific integrase n=1 Tax=Belnapia mucosa TaxID=2804532 RepID=A0ABS1VCF8_9PROT|nr:site-specific integrase [Belnapia mucosa]MBL6458826.1 site-specific integrase [Belnapia mucosa]